MKLILCVMMNNLLNHTKRSRFFIMFVFHLQLFKFPFVDFYIRTETKRMNLLRQVTWCRNETHPLCHDEQPSGHSFSLCLCFIYIFSSFPSSLVQFSTSQQYYCAVICLLFFTFEIHSAMHPPRCWLWSAYKKEE